MARAPFGRTIDVPGILLLAAACGAGTGPGDPVTPGDSTGTLFDTPVQGVSYSTTSGAGGVTSATGEYTFNSGDVVTFTLGSLTLGRAPATGVLTPIDLANGSALRLQNLLVLFQSLDGDGNPSNGIVIPPAAAAAVTAELNLALPAATFASSANAPLVAARAAAGITTPIVTANQANAEFKSQLLGLLGFNIWILSGENRAIVVRANPDGAYVHGEAGPADAVGQSGLERGTLLAAGFDPLGYWFDPAGTTFDSNGEWGLSHTDQTCERFIMWGDQLVAKNCQGATIASFKKAPNNPTGIVGAWTLGSPTTLTTVMILFFPNGRFFTMDPVGDTSGNGCGAPGIEYGSYTYTGNSLKVSAIAYDTDGCAGLSGSAAASSGGMSVTIASGGGSATIVEGGANVTLLRVSK